MKIETLTNCSPYKYTEEQIYNSDLSNSQLGFTIDTRYSHSNEQQSDNGTSPLSLGFFRVFRSDLIIYYSLKNGGICGGTCLVQWHVVLLHDRCFFQAKSKGKSFIRISEILSSNSSKGEVLGKNRAFCRKGVTLEPWPPLTHHWLPPFFETFGRPRLHKFSHLGHKGRTSYYAVCHSVRRWKESRIGLNLSWGSSGFIGTSTAQCSWVLSSSTNV